ncbi:hypothetical protein ACKWTF_015881 [Chironomus riparius]
MNFNALSMGMTQLSPNNLINARNLQEFDISFNRFTDGQAVMNLLNAHMELRRIDISSNSFTMFSLDFFSRFRNLVHLTVGGRDPSVPTEWQSLPSILTTLRVYQIAGNIPADAFSHLVNLVDLQFSGRGITAINEDTFTALTNLHSLTIFGTNLTTLDPGLFINQVNLEELLLHNNRIEVLPENVFAPLINLKSLDLFDNRLVRLPAHAFSQHPHLHSFDFGNNQINEIQRGIFSRLSPIMSWIDFGFNRCISRIFRNASNVDEIEDFQLGFNNFDGITTTTPNGCKMKFGKFEMILMIFVNILSAVFIIN